MERIEGQIIKIEQSEGPEIFILDELGQATSLADFACNCRHRNVSVKFAITSKPAESIEHVAVEILYGHMIADNSGRYSEYTGFLWWDEEFKIGGHDLLNQIRGCVGKYLILEVAIGEKPCAK
jgi:hypothetical protein